MNKINEPMILPMPLNDVKIQSISCGHNFTVLLSQSGLVFTFGTSNSHGELGLSRNNVYSPLSTQAFSISKKPILIETLAKNGIKIIQISCGFKHVLAKSSNFKVYLKMTKHNIT